MRPVADLTGRVAIVTGAARGLGRAAVERLHARGASVAINTRDAARATQHAASLGERALAVPGDLTAAGAPARLVRETLDRFGRVDIVVNNAALAKSTRLADLSLEEWRLALEVNMTYPASRAAPSSCWRPPSQRSDSPSRESGS